MESTVQYGTPHRRKRTEELAASTQRLYESFRRRHVSPRFRLAARLYASGAVPTKAAAADAVGLSRGAFYAMTMPSLTNPEVGRIQDDVDRQIHDKTIEMSSVLQVLGREAVSKIRKLMQSSNNEKIQLEAAKDLADRSPETSKVIKAQVTTASLGTVDAKELAAALVEAAAAKAKHAGIAQGDFIKVDLGQPNEGEVKLPLPPAKEQKPIVGVQVG